MVPESQAVGVRTLGVASAGRANNLDLVRFVAASLVLVSHCFPLTGRGSEEPLASGTDFDTLGAVSVNVFFVISGFLITQSFLRQASPWAFLEARALRIFPALMLVTVFGIALGAAMTSLPLGEYLMHPTTWRYLWTATLDIQYPLPGVFSDNIGSQAINGSLWTLPAEVSMYALTFFLGVATLLRDRGVGVTALGVAAVWILAAPGTLPLLVGSTPEYTTPAISYLMGSAFFLLRDRVPLSWSYVVAFAAAAYWFRYHPNARLLIWLAIAYGALWLSFARPLFSGFAYYGDFSYGMYLFAFPIQQWTLAVGLGSTPMAMLLVSFPLTLIASAVSWHLVEKRAIRWKGKLVRVNSAL